MNRPNHHEPRSIVERKRRRDRKRVESSISLIQSLAADKPHGSRKTLDETMKKLDWKHRHDVQLRVHGAVRNLDVLSEVAEDEKKPSIHRMKDALLNLLGSLHLASPRPYSPIP